MIVFTLIIFSMTAFLLNTRVAMFSLRPSLLGIFLLLSIFLQIVPGALLVTLLDFPMSYGLHFAIDEEVLIFTLWYTILSLSFLFLLLYLFSFFVEFNFKLSDMVFFKSDAYILSFISVIMMLVKIVSVGDIPILMAISGDQVGAAEQKARILRGEAGLGGFLIGYVFAYFHYAVLAYLYLAFRKKAVSGLLFLFYFFIVAIYSIYDMQKYNFAFCFLYVFFLSVVVDGIKIRKFLLVVASSIAVLFFSFFILHGGTFEEVFYKVAARLFIGQIEGSYMIYQALTPDLSRLQYGMPLGFIFSDFSVIDPAEEVVRIFFPAAGDAWVNSNTYVLAHAWSIFGFSAVFIAPISVSLAFLLLAVFRDIFKRYISSFSVCIYISLLITLRINNDFSYFMYGKFLVGFFSLVVFSFFIFIFKMFVVRQRS